MKKFRSRNFCLMLYEEDETHRNALKKICVDYDYAGVYHDRDVWTAEDEKTNLEHVAGELKKPHYHIVLRFKHAVWNTALAKDLGIEPNYLQETRNFDNALLYLLHYNDTDKAQYDISETFGTLQTRISELINKKEKSEGEKVSELLEYINDFEGRLSITQFAKYCAKNGYWAEFRRSGAIFCKIIEEKNNFFDNKRNIPI